MHLSALKDFPSEPHWVILTTSSTYIEGDERSRTNPGHGYPAHTITSINYEIFLKEDEWKEAIRKKEDAPYRREEYVAFKSSGRAKVTTQVSVENLTV